MPHFRLEAELGTLVAGLDEAGRGPLAGPVVAAAVVFRRPPGPTLAATLDDSKKLSPARRERALLLLRGSPDVAIAVSAASVAEIGRLNVLQASLLAMRRALLRLPCRPDHALVDGSITPVLPCPATPVIGGDGISLSIAAASIVAKVTRDRLMALLDRRRPGYGWSRNAGYGTAAHMDAMRTLGLTAHHRTTFRPVLRMLAATAAA